MPTYRGVLVYISVQGIENKLTHSLTPPLLVNIESQASTKRLKSSMALHLYEFADDVGVDDDDGDDDDISDAQRRPIQT